MGTPSVPGEEEDKEEEEVVVVEEEEVGEEEEEEERCPSLLLRPLGTPCLCNSGTFLAMVSLCIPRRVGSVPHSSRIAHIVLCRFKVLPAPCFGAREQSAA